mgnify:CR=1 FL=1
MLIKNNNIIFLSLILSIDYSLGFETRSVLSLTDFTFMVGKSIPILRNIFFQNPFFDL